MKNEEKNIEQCLQRLDKAIKAGWEVVVIDTGSTDKSRDIALRYTDKVYDFQWINDFSAARNFAAEKATNEYIFALDCDEFIEDIDIKKCESLIINNPKALLCPKRINVFERDGIDYRENEEITRVYSKNVYHYVGRIHEQVVKIDGTDAEFMPIPISMLHTGYMGSLEDRIKKAQRNIDLLEVELKENPKDSYILYQLGKSYFMQKNYTRAVEYFEEFMATKPDLALEYVENGIESYCYCLMKIDEYLKAEEIFETYIRVFKYMADFHFLGGCIYMNIGKFSDAATSFLNATQCSKYKVEGTNSYSALYNIGVIFECCGQGDTALEYYEKCGGYEPAIKGIERLKEEN